MSAIFVDQVKKTGKALAVGGKIFLGLATPVNLFFVVLLFVAGFALFNERIILVGFVSTLALLSAILAAGGLAAVLTGFDKTLSPGGFNLFLALSFVATLAIWSLELVNDIPVSQWLYVAGLAAIMLLFSLHLVPRLRRAYQSAGIMAQS